MDFEKYNSLMRKERKLSNRFSNTNITNYILAYLFIMITTITILVLYQHYINDKLPPNEFLALLIGTFMVELLAMAGIAMSKNKRGD